MWQSMKEFLLDLLSRINTPTFLKLPKIAVNVIERNSQNRIFYPPFVELLINQHLLYMAAEKGWIERKHNRIK